jgi:hypothetical protein
VAASHPRNDSIRATLFRVGLINDILILPRETARSITARSPEFTSLPRKETRVGRCPSSTPCRPPEIRAAAMASRMRAAASVTPTLVRYPHRLPEELKW